MNDYILMPRELTAENGARYALTGEFKDDIERQIIASYDERTAMRTTGIIAGVVLSAIVLVSVFMMIAS